MSIEKLRERMLRDPLPIRLGNFASALARLASWSAEPINEPVAQSVFEEAKCFAECAAPEATPEMQQALAETQETLNTWELVRKKGEPIAPLRSEIEKRSEKLLELSGILDIGWPEMKRRFLNANHEA